MSWNIREKAIQYARLDGHQVKKIAEGIGTTKQNLYSLMQRRGTRSPVLVVLDEWLKKHGYWDKANSTENDGASQELAELRQLIEDLKAQRDSLMKDMAKLRVRCLNCGRCDQKKAANE